jgi:transcription elongation factor Elf1
MADAFECARCGSDSADPRQFSRHGSAIDEAYCDSCWPIVARELGTSSEKIDPEKMKWIHEVMEGEEKGYHPGDDIESRETDTDFVDERGEGGVGVRHEIHGEGEAIDSTPTNYRIPFRNPRDRTPFFGGERSQEAQDVLGDKNIDFRASKNSFEYAWDMIVKQRKTE